MRVLNLGQGSADWLAWRIGGLGASDAPVLMGVSPYATREQLLDEKITGKRRETEFAMRRGNRLEPTARALYELERGVKAPPVCVLHDDYPWMMSSLDGLVTEEFDAPEEARIVEIKCWRWQNHDLCLCGIVPDEVYPQIQHQLMTTSLDHCDLVSYTEHSKFAQDEQLVIIEVGADAEYQAELFEREEAFWAEVMAGRKALQRTRTEAA